MAKVELQHLWKRYGDIVAVEDFSLVADDGEFIVFVGPSGCGKTTTLRMIAGLELPPTVGSVRRQGRHRRAAEQIATSRWCSRTTRCTRT